jgi:hypothetical protein
MIFPGAQMTSRGATMMRAQDPYALIRIPPEEVDGDEDRAWEAMDAAIASFDPNKAEPLISLLLDDDWLIRRRGLYIFGSLGKKSLVALDAALRFSKESDVMARSNLMDGVICYSRSLNVHQTQVVLRLADDSEELVRHKVVAFLGAAERVIIESAIELFDEPCRSDYQLGFMMFDAEPSQAQALFDEALTKTSIASTFALASIERMAREHRLCEAPKYDGDGHLGKCVLANTERLLRRGKA